MALKRKAKRNEMFSMASMTDVIFLLLIFFMVISTLVVPNAIKVNLPSSASAAPPSQPDARITVTYEPLTFYLAVGSEQPHAVSTAADMGQELSRIATAKPDGYVALFADSAVPYGNIVEVLNVVYQSGLRLVLATEALKADTPTPATGTPQ